MDTAACPDLTAVQCSASADSSRCEDPEEDCKVEMNSGNDQLDRYTQSIELYNACRKFYVTRLQFADDIKSKLNKELMSSGSETLDLSMEKLRAEVVSLIDQDLTLMHQLLTLNERIEELKWHRKLSGYMPAFLATSASSSNILDGDSSTPSDWDVMIQNGGEAGRCGASADPDCDADLLHSKYLSPSKLSLFRECLYNSAQDSLHELTSSSANDVRLSDKLAQSRTSDLGSSGELVSGSGTSSDCRPKVNNPYRLSGGDSCISSGCPSNSSSLKKSDVDDDVIGSLSGVGDRLCDVSSRRDDETTATKQCHDSGIHEDHNLEMII